MSEDSYQKQVKDPMQSIQAKMVDQTKKEIQKKREEAVKKLSDTYSIMKKLVAEIQTLDAEEKEQSEHLTSVINLIKNND